MNQRNNTERRGAIPKTLRALPRWIAWSLTQNRKTGRWTKRPHGSVLDSNAYGPFETVASIEVNDKGGIGLVFTGGVEVEGLRLVAFDMDACRDPKSGELSPWAEQVLDHYKRSWTEITPSGAGLRLWLLVKNPPQALPTIRIPEDPPPGVDKRPEIQVFGCGSAQYVTVTGEQLQDSADDILPFLDLTWLQEHYKVDELEETEIELPVGEGEPPSTAAIKERLEKVPQAAEMLAGNWETVGTDSASELWYRLVRHALRVASGHGQAVSDFLLTETAFGRGEIDSRDPDRYMRPDWVYKDVARIAGKSDDKPAADVFEPLDDDWETPTAPTEQRSDDNRPERSGLFNDWEEADNIPDWTTPPAPREYLLWHPVTAAQELTGDRDGFMPQGEACTLSSAGGVGKTYAVVQLALSVATGKPWLGHFPVEETQARRVLLLLGEEDADEIHRRIHYAGKSMGLTSAELRTAQERIKALPLMGKVRPLLRLDTGGRVEPTEHLKALRELLKRPGDPWGLVVLDPQARFAGVEVESNNAVATVFVQSCEMLTTAPGKPTVLVLAHSSKHARRQGDADSRGVTGLTDGFRWHATLSRDKGGAAVELKVEKNNYGRPSEPVRLRQRDGGPLFTETAAERAAADATKAEEQKDAAAQKMDELVRRAVEVVKKTGKCSSRESIAKQMGGRLTDARAAVDMAVDRGFLHCKTLSPRRSEYSIAAAEVEDG